MSAAQCDYEHYNNCSVASSVDFPPNWADFDAVPQRKMAFCGLWIFGLLLGKSTDFWTKLDTALNFVYFARNLMRIYYKSCSMIFLPFLRGKIAFHGLWIFGLLFGKSADFGANLDTALKFVYFARNLKWIYNKSLIWATQ